MLEFLVPRGRFFLSPGMPFGLQAGLSRRVLFLLFRMCIARRSTKVARTYGARVFVGRLEVTMLV